MNDKWGFVVYRTTYNDDEEWNRVKQIIIDQATKRLRIPDLANYMDWSFIDDKAALNGASRAFLRQQFRSWAAQQQGDGGPPRFSGSSRYVFFLEVDEESLRSMIDKTGGRRHGHINLVDSLWEPDMSRPESEADRLQELEDEAEREPIDGCREEVVG